MNKKMPLSNMRLLRFGRQNVLNPLTGQRSMIVELESPNVEKN